MLEGTYVVLAQTPVGSKRGEVTFSHGETSRSGQY